MAATTKSIELHPLGPPRRLPRPDGLKTASGVTSGGSISSARLVSHTLPCKMESDPNRNLALIPKLREELYGCGAAVGTFPLIGT
jgi:hypothetical protein